MAGEDPKNKSSEEPKPDEKLGEGGMRALQAERDANKQLRAEMQKLRDEIQAAQDEKLTKEEQLTKRLTEAEAKAKSLEDANTRRALRDKIAEEVGVPAELVSGDDEEGMRANATRLKAWNEDATGPRVPKKDPGQGAGSGEAGTDEDADALEILGFSG